LDFSLFFSSFLECWSIFSVEPVREELSMEKLIKKRVGRNRKTEYLLKWRGYGDEVE
jgi:hypothetical protein